MSVQSVKKLQVVVTTVSVCVDELIMFWHRLEEGGQTALGPAMAVAILMASKVPGSKVVMCTDGLANVGLGNLDTESADEHAEASDYYSQLGETAKENGFVQTTCSLSD